MLKTSQISAILGGYQTSSMKEPDMAKGQITKKNEKKPPLKTPKEKKAAKQAKKASKA